MGTLKKNLDIQQYMLDFLEDFSFHFKAHYSTYFISIDATFNCIST